MGRIFNKLSSSWLLLLPILLAGMATATTALATCYCAENFFANTDETFCNPVTGVNAIPCSPVPIKASDCNCGSHGQVASVSGDFFCVDLSVAQPFACGTPNPYYSTVTTTMPTATATSSVTSAVTTSATTATDSMTTIATEMPETQSGAVKAAGNVALTGANNKANGALLFCAEGANREVEAAGTGADDIATCQNDFKAADHMANMAAQNGLDATLKRDEGMLNDAAALAALEKFEKNFGVNKDDYVNRMLASHGKSTEFADMLSSKFTDDKLDRLFTAAAEATPAESKESAIAQTSDADQARGVTKAKSGTSLRDSLKAKLEAADANRKLASAKLPQTDYRSVKNPNEKLHPAGLEAWISGSEEQQEESLTIFDVIHQKLQSLRQRERI